MFSIEENKALVRRLIEDDLNGDDRAVADAIVAEDFVDHTNPPGITHGLANHKLIVTIFRAAFPDARWTIEDMIAEGDRVTVRIPMTGTHRGDFFGIPATGRQVNVNGIHILRCANGKVAEHWGVNDDMGMMQQLGVVPSAEPAPVG